MTPDKFSETNVVNTVSRYVASKLLAENYLVYWHARDAVETPDGWYFEWSTNYATYMLDATFLARETAAKGLVVLTDSLPAEPRFVERPITQVGPINQNEVPIPALSIEVGPSKFVAEYEIGSGLKWRYRHLIVDGYVRTRAEQAKFKDFLALWFEHNQLFDIADNDAGSTAIVGTVYVQEPDVDYAIYTDTPKATTFQVICNARLDYIA